MYCFNLAIDHRSCHVIVAIQTQAPDIAQKVHEGKAPEEVGAGDQVKFSLPHFHVNAFCVLYLCYFRE